MATIASLLVNLGMNVAGFSTGSKSAIRDLNAVSTAVTGLNSAFQLAQGGIGLMKTAFASFRAVGESVRNIGELSEITGISTQRMVALQSAGKRFGVDVETLNVGLKKMVVNLGKAQEEGSPAAEAFEKIGLNAGLLNKLGGDAAFNSIANAISQLPTPAEKAAAAVEIFGRSGADLVNVLNQGKDGIDAIAKSAEAAGLAFSKADAEQLTNNLRQMDAIGKELNGTWRQIAITVGPTMALLAGEAASIAKDTAHFISQLSHGKIGDAVSGGLYNIGKHVSLNGIADVQDKQRKAAEDALYAPKGKKPIMVTDLEETGAAAQKAGKEVNGFAELYKALDKEQENRNRLFEVALTPLDQYRKKVNDIYDAMARLQKANTLSFVGDATFKDQKAKLNQALGRVNADEYKRRNAEQTSAVKSLKDSLETPGQALAKAMQTIQAGTKSGDLSPQEAALARIRAQRTFLEAQPQANRIGDRPGAVEFNSAEGIAASFGQKPADKIQAAIKRLDEQQLLVMQNIEKKLGITFKIPA